MNPRALIAEDEPVLRAGFKKLLARVWPELDIIATASDGLEARQLLDKHAPEVLFLDIEMPGCSGLDVARAASGRCHVVFVTGYDQHAVTAFERGAVDYLMKPITAARLSMACSRVKQHLATMPANLDAVVQRLADMIANKPSYLHWINVETGANVQLVTVHEICYFQSDTKYTRLVTAKREALIRMSLKELLDVLDPSEFWQIHRSTIVNVNAIAEVSRDLRGHPTLHLKQRDESLQVSQPFAHLFRQM
ncbi:MAG TPA: LytTR family DNA-binding domain-containing protein [Casimicrobiaceae bacterium]